MVKWNWGTDRNRCGRPLQLLAFCAAMVLSTFSAQATDPGDVVNDGIFGLSTAASPYTTFSSGKLIGPWKVDSGSVDVNVGYYSTPPASGNSVDLNGSAAGSISQTVKLVPGKTYTLTFLMSGNWSSFSSTARSVNVSIGSWSQNVSMNRPSGWSRTNMGWQTKTYQFVASTTSEVLKIKSNSTGTSSYGPVIAKVELETDVEPPKALDSIPVPLPSDLATYVKDRDKAILLGKALFWDMQTGGDGRTACATCHWHAGADIRTKNQLNPGAPSGTPDLANFRGPNKTLKASDFPFHRFLDPTRPGENSPNGSSDNPVTYDTMEVAGSQGVVSKQFNNIVPGSAVDNGTTTVHPVFSIDGVNVRQVTGRNAPTSINAVYFDRSFWDGRANRYFNGVNPFGNLDPNAAVLRLNSTTNTLESVKIRIDNAALASQAVGPPNNSVEMSWDGRSFSELARKMLSLRPLALQNVAGDDSVLGAYRDASGKGLNNSTAAYSKLIREAFQPQWWSGSSLTADGYTHMEANFSLFWGLSIMLYESTLTSGQTPYDAYAKGDSSALSAKAKRGLQIFLKEGKCINCHGGPEFAGGTVSSLRGVLSDDGLIEFMAMELDAAFYDGGFYNIGVRPQEEDLGVGGSHPQFGPFSYTRQEQAGKNPDPKVSVPKKAAIAVDGAFKTPTLRNIELTGPYMHNGGMKNLTEVVQFYTRGADFRHTNLLDLDPDVSGIPELQGNPEDIDAVVEFMKHLTDPRVKYQKAPFDHPELIIPNGHTGISNGQALDNNFVLPATGRNGGAPFGTFEEALNNGL